MKDFNNYTAPAWPAIQSTYYNESYQKYLPLKACDFYWSCSRKSYLPCGQSYDVASYDSILGCINAGARLLNLDIYADNQNPDTPVVRNSTMMPYYGTPLDLGKCFGLIASNAFSSGKGAQYPLVLYLTLNSMNPILLQNVAAAIRKYFGSMLVNRKYGYDGREGLFPFSQIPIADMLGKVAIITDKYPTVASLNEFIHGSTADNSVISVHTYSVDDQRYGGISVKNSDVEDLTNFNRTNITMVNTPDDTSMANVHNPKADLVNPEPTDCWKYGCQWVMMNYQLYDANMQKYFAVMMKGGLQLKPDSLREIPVLPKPVKEQNPKLYYAPQKYTQKGWYSFNL